jgi:hypothetical protein
MPRHHSVPDNQTGWIRLGTVSTDTAMFAIVAPEMAGVLGDDWTARYLGEDGEPLPPPARPSEHELVEFEELDVGDDKAVLFTTHCDGGYLVEGRFGDIYGGGHMSLTEVRIRIWVCECTCHDSEPDGGATCDGDCHDEDPS